MPNPKPIRVLLVDDDQEEFTLTGNKLSSIAQNPYVLDWVGDYAQALQALEGGQHDMVLIDYRLDGRRSGLDLLREAKFRGCRAPMILLTGLRDAAVDGEALAAGAADYLVKGQFDTDVLDRSLRYSLERARTLDELRRSEAKYRRIVDGTHTLLFETDLKGRLTYANDAAADAVGLPPGGLLGRCFLRLLDTSEAGKVREACAALLRGRTPGCSFEVRLAPQARERWLSVQLDLRLEEGRPQGFAGMAQDVTEVHRLQGMFLQSEKLSAMGLLAAGVAHELNNPLMIILGFCEVALGLVKKASPVASHLKTIERAAKRCRDLVQDMLLFSRKEDEPPRPFELADCLSCALALVEPQAKYHSIKVVRDFCVEPMRVLGHKNQLEQVIINLAGNAIDAMPRGGTLTIRTRPMERHEQPGVLIQVADTGKGIPLQLQERIFEAFFTTKGPGKGTGLGLSLSSEIVGKHGGKLEVSSVEGEGSVFSVTLPRA